MKLGTITIFLNVKDISVSKAFDEDLGFSLFDGNIEYNYLIKKKVIH